MRAASLVARLSLAGALILASEPSARGQDTAGVGAIEGTIVDGRRQAVVGAAVCAQGSSRCAVSEAGGRFRIDELRAGRYPLEVTASSGTPTVTEPVDVRPGLTTSVDVTLPDSAALTQTVTVTAPLFSPPPPIKTSAFLVRPVEIATSAGALQDVSRYIQSLPGVAIGTNDFRNDLIVRGGSPLENLFIVDNVEVPNINTFANFASAGGTVSILDTALIEDVTFLTGGYPAPYTNRTSSVLQITQREGSREGVGARVTLGFAGVGGIAEGPIGGARRGSWVVSLRRSFLDLVTDDIGIGGVPVLYTGNAKAVYDLSSRDRVWLVHLAGVDRIRLGLAEDSDLDDELANFDIRYRGRRTATGLNWQRLLGARGVGLLGVAHSFASVGSTVKDLVRDGVPPVDRPIDDVIADAALVFREDSSEHEVSIKYDLTLDLPVLGTLQAGSSVKRFAIRYDTAAPFGSDSPYAVMPGRDAFDIGLRFPAWQSSAYVQTTAPLARRASLTVGARLDDFDYVQEARISPRVGVDVPLTDRLSARASWGRYHQLPPFLFLAAFPENRRLVPFRADHLVAGVSYRGGTDWRLTVEGYRKAYDDYPVAAAYPALSFANIGDTFNVREILFPLTSEGRGRASGVEVFVEKKGDGPWFGQANLAVSRARHAGRDGLLRPGSFDYPVVANIVGGYRWAAPWLVSTRVSYLSGRPYTPFDEALSREQRRGIFDLDRVNALRASAYVRIDLRIERRLTVAGQPFSLFFGVQNVLNRENVARPTWNRRTNTPGLDTQQGLFPILGFDWQIAGR